ncbi:endo-1,4-beta-xylanase [Eubacterium xylanophilum]|uniref:endo-1,4-beta-xylanase n=1 Tax=Eubacterium xylanophilum TaxID=39497 RepID=UPI0004B4B7E0|nr:endo-1,4-beta-xylanase [Eubacterium xylanophilum]
MKEWKKRAAGVLVGVMAISMVTPVVGTNAAAKPKLSTKKVTVKVGAKKKLSVKKAKGFKVTWKATKKKIVTLKKKGKYAVNIIGKKKGNTSVVATLKKGKTKKKLTCKVVVKAKSVAKGTDSKPAATADTAAAATNAPVSQSAAPAVSATPEATVAPTSTPVVYDKPTDYVGIKDAYKDFVGTLGTCINTWQLTDSEAMDHVKRHYNSVTMENEMKPEAILPKSASDTVSIEEAKALGYDIPTSYVDSVVPKLRFDNVDAAMENAHKNGLRMRAHTLVWHSQTPSWFFQEFGGTKKVSEETMTGRLEFYIRNVMKHVMEQEKKLGVQPGDIVYTWDVVNEYLHRSGNPSWHTVYKYDDEDENKLRPKYVKLAFEFAHQMRKEYGVQDKVALIFNDYDTYFEVPNEIAVINFINENEPEKICDGIGMQSHVDIKRPTIDGEEGYITALKAFMNEGYEVQITELDMTINFDTDDTDGRRPRYDYRDEGETLDEQAVFCGNLMREILKAHVNRDKTKCPKGLTGITLWGLYDSISWRGKSEPLLFKSLTEPKESYMKFVAAPSEVAAELAK